MSGGSGKRQRSARQRADGAREAIRVLESIELVNSRRRVGITIQSAEHWNVFDPRVIRWRIDSGDRVAQLVSLSELRRGFEPAAAALAARRDRTT